MFTGRDSPAKCYVRSHYRNACANSVFLPCANKLGAPEWIAARTKADSHAFVSLMSDRLQGIRLKSALERASRRIAAQRFSQRKKWHSRWQSGEKPHSNSPGWAAPAASSPHCSPAGIWWGLGRHSQTWQPAVSPGSSSDSLRGAGTFDISSATRRGAPTSSQA